MNQQKNIPLIFTKECGYVPAVLVNAGEIIEKHIETENLFQLQGSTAKLKKLMSILSLQKMPRLKKFHVHDVVEVIKVSLTRLSKELIPDHVMSLLIEANQSQMTDYTTILALYRRTSPLTFSAVHFTMRLLNKVIEHSASNGMDARKLATIFVLDVLKPLTAPRHDDQRECDYEVVRHNRLEKLPYLIMVMEQLILKVSAFKKASIYRPEVKQKSGSSVENFDRKGTESAFGDSMSKGTPEEAVGATFLNGHSPKPEPLALEEERWPTDKNKPVEGDNFPTRSVSQTGLASRRGQSSFWKQPAADVKKSRSQANKRLFSSSRSTSELGMNYSRTKTTANVYAGRRGKFLAATRLKAKKVSSGASKSKMTIPGWKGTLSHGLLKKETVTNKSLNMVMSSSRNFRGVRFRRVRGLSDSSFKKHLTIPFHRDEELLPWPNFQFESDDSSTMQRSIRYPRVDKNVLSAQCENSRVASENEDDSRNDLSLRVNGSSQGNMGKSEPPTLLCQSLSAGSEAHSLNAKMPDSTQPFYKRELTLTKEKSSLVFVSSTVKRENSYSLCCNKSCSSTLKGSDSESQSTRWSIEVTTTVKNTLPNLSPILKERHKNIQRLNTLCILKKSNGCLQRATEIVLLGLALFCTCFVFLLLQWYQGD